MNDPDCPTHCHGLTELHDKVAILEHSIQLAFPDGPSNHGKYHQKLIDAAKAEEKFWLDLSDDLKRKGIRAVILIVIGLIVVKVFGPDSIKYLLKVLG